MITKELCRAARGLLGWTQQDLADASGLSKTSINNFEKGHSNIKLESLEAIRASFEKAGVEFLADKGVQIRSEYAKIFKGSTAYEELLTELIKDKNIQDDLMIAIGENVLFKENENDRLVQFLEDNKLQKITKILCAKDSFSYFKKFQCRSLPITTEQIIHTYVCGNKVALKWWDEFNLLIVSGDIAAGAKETFKENWERSSAKV